MISRPPRFFPFIDSITWSTTSSSTSTKPNPLDRPLSLSVIILLPFTSAAVEKNWARSSSVVDHGRFPTYSVLDTRLTLFHPFLRCVSQEVVAVPIPDEPTLFSPSHPTQPMFILRSLDWSIRKDAIQPDQENLPRKEEWCHHR